MSAAPMDVADTAAAPSQADAKTTTSSGEAMHIDTDAPESHASSADTQLQQPNGGVLLGWGSGFFGLMASADESVRPAPVRLAGVRSVSSIAVGATHALACGADGTLYSWGDGDEGKLGLGDRKSRNTPTELASLQSKSICFATAGYAHSFALTDKGEALAFGAGEMGALGLTMRKRPAGTLPDLTAHLVPALVRELYSQTRIIQLACGDSHSLALSSAGRVYSVGDGSRGALALDFANSAHVNSKGNAPALSDGSGVRVPVFTEVISLLPIPIASLAAGSHHSLFVSASGTVYSCGDASKGRLGYAAPSTGGNVQWLPRRITGALDGKFVMSASAGAQFSLFLTQQYVVYATGSNAHGELGQDAVTLRQLDSPALVPGLESILQISAGSTHALARDSQNRVWSWGSGEMGELGQGADAPLRNSTSVGLVALPSLFTHQHVVSVAAGSNTSFAIVAETVLTSKRSRGALSPNRLVASSGGTAAQASPNTPQTYALYKPTSDISDSSSAASASAASASAAASSTVAPPAAAPADAAVPQFVVRPSASPLALNAFSYAHFSSLLAKQDYPALASYTQYAFSSALILNASFLPRASAGGGAHINHTLLELVYSGVLRATLAYPRLQTVLATAIQKTISSMHALMKASRQPPSDLAAYRAVFICLQSPHLLHGSMATTAVLTDLAYILTRMPRAVAERVPTIYAHVPLDLFRKRFIKVLTLNVERRMQQNLHGLPITARLRHSSEDMQDLVYILSGMHSALEQRGALVKKARRRNRGGSAALIEELSGGGRDSPDTELLPDSAWHLPHLENYVDLKTDLESYVAPVPTAAQLPPFSFMRFPWLLSPATKAAYLRTEFAVRQQQQALTHAILQLNPMLELTIRRDRVVEDAINSLNAHSLFELRKPLKIQFMSNGVPEVGEDQGGLSAEFFELVVRKLFQPQYALFERKDQWKSMWFASLEVDPSKAALYELYGRLLALMIYNSASVSLNFPSFLYAQLLGIKPTLAHLRSADPQLADSLQELLDYDGDVENVFCLNFAIDVPERTEEEQLLLMTPLERSVSEEALMMSPVAAPALMVVDEAGAPASDASASSSQALIPARRPRMRTVPLLPGGEDINVTQANKVEYVAAYLQYILTDSVKDALQPLIAGFQSLVGLARGSSPNSSETTVSMRLFTPSDLELVVVGSKALDYTELRRGTRYEGGYNAQHPTIRAFWEVVLGDSSKDPLALTRTEQRQLLLFTTGSSRAPVGGLSETRLLIQRAGPDTDALPTSSTCFHALLLPEYSSKERLSGKLKIALANAVGFGLR